MLKKRYIIIVLGIVSVLLGSLLYTNLALAGDITPSGKPQPAIYKDSVELTLFTSPEILGVWGLLATDYPMDFPFRFSPKQTFLHATNLFVLVIATHYIGNPTWISFDLTLNDESTLSTGSLHYPPYAKLKTVSTNMLSAVGTITEGINMLTLSNSTTDLAIFEVTIFIEYEYQA